MTSSWNVIQGADPDWTAFVVDPISAVVERTLSFFREDWTLTLEDLSESLAEMSRSTKPFLIEGARLLPEGVAKLVTHSNQAVWLAPSRSVIEKRVCGWQRLIDRFPDPGHGKRRMVSWFRATSEMIVANAKRVGLNVVRISVNDTPEAVASRVARVFCL